MYDGVEAIARARQWRPEVVLLDIGLPTLSGYDVCHAIRELAGGEAVLIFALTGWGRRPIWSGRVGPGSTPIS